MAETRSTMRHRTTTGTGAATNSSAQKEENDAQPTINQAEDTQQTQTTTPFPTTPSSPPSPSSSPFRPFRFLPSILLFVFLFLTLSYLFTGTTPSSTYQTHLQPILTQYTLFSRLQWNRMKLYVQEVIGFRKPSRIFQAPPPSSSSSSDLNGGYGGITKKKKKKSQPPIITSENDGSNSGSGDSYAPLVIVRPNPRDPKALYLTPSQLSQFTGEDGGPIFLSIHGRIFDVTSGYSFYGPGQSYSNLVGKDCSRGFVTNCFNNENQHDLRGLTNEQRKGIDSWYKFYEGHHTYQPVGWLDVPDIPEDAPLPIDTC